MQLAQFKLTSLSAGLQVCPCDTNTNDNNIGAYLLQMVGYFTKQTQDTKVTKEQWVGTVQLN